jgi:Sulfotransferase family
LTQTPPVLLHVGYHKTGSRWLRALFFGNSSTGFGWVDKAGVDHPVRRLVAARPLEFDAERSRAEFEPLLRRIVDEGRSPVVSFERFSGNPFSGGYDSKEIADRLVQVFPDARVLVVVREQRSMIVSTYKQYVREGGALSPSKFMLPPVSRSLRVPWFDLRHFEYHHLLAYYRGLFGPEAVLGLSYEQFVADPRSFVEQIARFAGRPLSDETLASLPFETRTNPGPPATAITLRRVLNGIGVCTDLNPAPPLASPVFWRLGKRIDRLSLAPRQVVDREEEKLRSTVEGIVGDRYVDSNRRTAELLGVDLGAYGWMT